MLKHSLPSIEKFAAFLDGNLPPREMQHFSSLVEHDGVLHQLLDASSVVDDTLAGFTDSDLQLPQDIISSDFELPTIPSDGISPLVTLSPEPMDDILVAAAACADDISMISDVNPEVHSIIEGELQGESSHLMPDDAASGSNDDFSSSLPDEL